MELTPIIVQENYNTKTKVPKPQTRKGKNFALKSKPEQNALSLNKSFLKRPVQDLVLGNIQNQIT